MYSTNYSKEDKLDDETLQTVLGSLMAIWLLSFVTFASVINREYLHTFYDMDKTSSYNKKWFQSQREDQDLEKSTIFTCHPDVYKVWGDELIKPWTIENWNRWESEKPVWFTDTWIEAVPNEYIPFDWRVKYKKTKGRVDAGPQGRRRSSIKQQVKMLMGEES